MIDYYSGYDLEEVRKEVLLYVYVKQEDMSIESIRNGLNNKYRTWLINKIIWKLIDDGICEIYKTKIRLRNKIKCKYNDCGWCYAPKEVTNNAKYGQCLNPNECPSLESQIKPKPIIINQGDDIIFYGGVKYQKVEAVEKKPKVSTLYDIIEEKLLLYYKQENNAHVVDGDDLYYFIDDLIYNINEKWIPKETKAEYLDSYSNGRNDTIKQLKLTLR